MLWKMDEYALGLFIQQRNTGFTLSDLLCFIDVTLAFLELQSITYEFLHFIWWELHGVKSIGEAEMLIIKIKAENP